MTRPAATARAAALAAALVLPLASPAAAFIADNGGPVHATGQNSFTVEFQGQTGAMWFWCGAGDYAIRHLHVPPATRIWRTSAVPRHAGQPISFSLSSRGAARSTGLIGFGPDDGSLSAAMAQEFCTQLRLFRYD